MVDEHTIIAQSTPTGSGAIAVIRLSGPQAISIADQMAQLVRREQTLREAASHTIHLGSVVAADGAIVDQVLFSLMRAPKTFTGEDVIEISCHNNSFIIQAIIARAIDLGAHPAQRGEFTRRAVEHGKIDIIRAEAINELIGAQTELALQKSLAQLGGSLSAWVAELEEQLIKSLALCEASFEFLEGEVDFTPQIVAGISQVREKIAQIGKAYGMRKQIREGIRIAIVGPVNAGKSSLFNRLIGQQRAIVTPVAGTTRDTIEASVDRHGVHWTLIDTAGIRQTADEIEQEGIRRSRDEARSADIVILVFDATAPLSAELAPVYEDLMNECNAKIIPVTTKSDLVDIQTLRQAQGERRELLFTQSKFIPTQARRSLGEDWDLSRKQIQDEPNECVNFITLNDTAPKKTTRTKPTKEQTYSARPELVEGSERAATTTLPLSNKTGAGVEALEAAITDKINTLFATANAPFLINQRHHTLLRELDLTLQQTADMLAIPTVHHELVAHHLRDALERISQLSGRSISQTAVDQIFRDFCVGK